MGYTWFFRRPLPRPNAFCYYKLLCFANIYTLILGIIGTISMGVDFNRMITARCAPPNSFFRAHTIVWKSLTQTHYREIKIIALACAFEYNFLLIIGTVVRCQTFFIPWLIFEGFSVNLELVSSFIAILSRDTKFAAIKHLLMCLLLIYNWGSVFCACSNIITNNF